LKQLGFKLERELHLLIRKQYARRHIVGYKSPYDDPFSYRSLGELGTAAFVEAFKLVCVDSAGIDVVEYLQRPETEFRGLVEYAGSAFDPDDWLLAFTGGELAGMVLPQRFHDTPAEGTLFLIALVPAQRQRGYGKILHAKGLEALATRGVERYVGSTHVDNTPMIRVFEQNGCQLGAIREQETTTPPS
jgi:ribosomal protein S18 acetylase RimI-like enzyme